MTNETNATIDEIMQAAVDLGDQRLMVMFDRATRDDVRDAEGALRDRISAALDGQARQIAALTAERDNLSYAVIGTICREDAPEPGHWLMPAWEFGRDIRAERYELRKRLDDAKPATPAPGEWVEWKGGECPLTDDVIGAVRMRDGWESGPCHLKPSLTWSHSGSNGDIVAYRILP